MADRGFFRRSFFCSFFLFSFLTFKDFGETTKSLEQFVTEIGNVEAMMRGRLMDLVRSLEAQNKEDKAKLHETTSGYNHLMMKYQELEQLHSKLENRYSFSVSLRFDQLATRYGELEEQYKNLQRHCNDLELENQSLRVRGGKLVMECEILRRQFHTALQAPQLQNAGTGNAPVTGPSHEINKPDSPQAMATVTNESIQTEQRGTYILPKPQEHPHGGAPMDGQRMESLGTMVLGSRQLPPQPPSEEIKKNKKGVTSHLYHCPVDNCASTFSFPRNLDPPIDNTGRISDEQPWDAERFPIQIEILRLHMKKRHASVPETLWPPGFAKRLRPNPVGEQGDYLWYTCPSKDCEIQFAFDVNSKPPLDKNGQVSDAVAWDVKILGNKIKGIQNHLRVAHPEYTEDQWPIGICPTKPTNEKLSGCHKYKCPVDGCSQIFEIAKKLRPPLDANGKVTDSVKWYTRRLDPVLTSITRHLQTKHPDIPYMKWPTALAPEPVDTASEVVDVVDDDTDDDNDDNGSASSHSSGEEKQSDNQEYDNDDVGEGVLVI